MAGDPKQKRQKAQKQTAIDGKQPQFDHKSIRLATAADGDYKKGTYVDEYGNTLHCKKCEKQDNPGFKKGHQKWCPRSKYYGKGPLEIDAMQRKQKGDAIIRANSKKKSNMTKEAVDNFFRKRNQPASPPKDSKKPKLGLSPYEAAIAEETGAGKDPASNNSLTIQLDTELAMEETHPQASAPVEPTAPTVELQVSPHQRWPFGGPRGLLAVDSRNRYP